VKHRLIHPPELTKHGDRFVVMLQVGTIKGAPAWEPLAYGLPGQPSPEMLLRRGHRCTGFFSEPQAWDHLDKAAEAWKAAGLRFHRGKQISVLRVESVSA
jgi:hypothetical protein